MTFGTSRKEIFVVRVQSNRIVFQCFDGTPIGRLEYRRETEQDGRNHSQSHVRYDRNRVRLGVKADG